MEDTAARKRRRDASEDDEAGDTAGEALGSSSRHATGIAEEKPAETLLLFIQEEDEAASAAFMEEPADDGTPPHALREREIDFFCYPPADDGGRGRGGATAGLCLFAADQEPGVVDVALTLGGTGPLVARREDTVDATLRLGLGPHPPSAATHVAAAALGEAEDDDDDLHYLRLHGVPLSASTGPKLEDPFWYPLPFADDLPCRGPPPSPATPEDHSALPEEGRFVVVLENALNSFVTTGDDGSVEFVTDDATDRPSGSTVLNLNQTCSSEFPDDIAGDVDERPGRETAEQRPQSSTPYRRTPSSRPCAQDVGAPSSSRS